MSSDGDVHDHASGQRSSSASTNRVLGDIFRGHHHWLKQLIHRRSGSPTIAEDVASETFLQLLRAPALEHLAEPRALLRTIANRILYKLWRRRDLERACAETLATLYGREEHSSPEQAALLVEAVQLIDTVLASLPPREREIFLRYRLEGDTYAEIGADFDLSASAVRRIVGKGLRLCLLAMEEE